MQKPAPEAGIGLVGLRQGGRHGAGGSRGHGFFGRDQPQPVQHDEELAAGSGPKDPRAVAPGQQVAITPRCPAGWRLRPKADGRVPRSRHGHCLR